MSKFTVAAKRFGGFLKRNAFYLLIILCIASVATVIALAVTYNTGTPDTDLNNVDDTPTLKPDDNKPSVDDPGNNDNDNPPEKKLTFIAPTNGTISQEFDTTMVSNPTMGYWATHCALDFVSEDAKVFASADGVVKKIGHNDLDGNYIVIEHEDGYTTKYMSLDTLEDIKEGATVKQGQLIGKMSDSQGTEALSGAHLHFELHKDGKAINPLEVIVLEEK